MHITCFQEYYIHHVFTYILIDATLINKKGSNKSYFVPSTVQYIKNIQLCDLVNTRVNGFHTKRYSVTTNHGFQFNSKITSVIDLTRRISNILIVEPFKTTMSNS